MISNFSICKGDVCLHAKGELAETIAIAIFVAILAYGVRNAIKSLN